MYSVCDVRSLLNPSVPALNPRPPFNQAFAYIQISGFCNLHLDIQMESTTPAAAGPLAAAETTPVIRDQGNKAAKRSSTSCLAASNKKLKESAAPAAAADTALQPLAAIREEGNTAAKKRSRSSPAASSASNKNKKLKETIQVFTCEPCQRNFLTAPALKQHQTKTHTNRHVGQELKEPRRLAPAVPQGERLVAHPLAGKT